MGHKQRLVDVHVAAGDALLGAAHGAKETRMDGDLGEWLMSRVEAPFPSEIPVQIFCVLGGER